MRINAPFVTTAGGAAPVTISPNPPRFLSYTGVAGTQRGFTYTARDARGNTATCTVVLRVVLGMLLTSFMDRCTVRNFVAVVIPTATRPVPKLTQSHPAFGWL